jgi:hypothetical protein
MNIAFCFIVKDGEKYLQNNLNRIIKLGEKFNKYKIFYAENDSIDSTKEILSYYKNINSNISGIHLLIDKKHSTELCKSNEDYNCKLRTRRLAYLRNKVLEQAKQWKECNILIMLDLDFVDFDENEFMNMFTILQNDKNIDAIFGMSVIATNKNYLYDFGAIRPIYKCINIIFSDVLVKVTSAFSGFGIYRMNSIITNNILYNENTNDIEHIDFNKQLNNLYVYTKFRPVYEGTSSICFISINYIIILLIIIFIFI